MMLSFKLDIKVESSGVWRNLETGGLMLQHYNIVYDDTIIHFITL